MDKQRDIVFDALKLFAIFLVLWGHAIQHLLSSEYYDEPVYRIIYSFHMPLFMSMVGYFSHSLLDLSYKEVFLKKCRQLLLPAASFGIIYLLLGLYNKSGAWYAYVSCFWFLKSAFVCCLLYYIFKKLFHRTWLVILISLFVSLLIDMFQINFMYPCFLFGLLLRTCINKIKLYSGGGFLVSGLLFIFLLLFWNASFWDIPTKGLILNSLPDMRPFCSYVYKVSYRIGIGLVGTFCCVTLFQYLAAKIKLPISLDRISKYGSETLGIYLIHSLIFEVVLHRYCNCDTVDFYIFNFVLAPIISFLVLIFSLLLISLINKSSILSFILLGKPYKCSRCFIPKRTHL